MSIFYFGYVICQPYVNFHLPSYSGKLNDVDSQCSDIACLQVPTSIIITASVEFITQDHQH